MNRKQTIKTFLLAGTLLGSIPAQAQTFESDTFVNITPSFFMAVPKAHFAFYKTLKHFRVKRKVNQKETVQANHLQTFKRSIIFSFFVRKVRKFSDLSPKGWR